MEGSAAGDLSGAGSGGGSGWGSGAGEEAEGDEDENMVYYFLEESTGYMEPALRCLSLLHTLVAFLCIIGYNCLKVGHDHGSGAGAGWVGSPLVVGTGDLEPESGPGIWVQDWGLRQGQRSNWERMGVTVEEPGLVTMVICGSRGQICHCKYYFLYADQLVNGGPWVSLGSQT